MMKKLILVTVVATTMLAPAVIAGPYHGRDRAADRMVVLSEELIDATRNMQYFVDRRQRGRWARSSALSINLQRLEDQALRFRRAAIRDAHPRKVQLRLESLLITFNNAERNMRYVRNGRLHREFDQIDRLMRRLTRKVEVAYGFNDHRDRRHARNRVHGDVLIGDRDDRFRARIRF